MLEVEREFSDNIDINRVSDARNVDRQVVSSSTIHSVGYDEVDKILEIEFKSGGIYQYSSVSESVYRDFMNASSMGSFFHQYIKKNFKTLRVA